MDTKNLLRTDTEALTIGDIVWVALPDDDGRFWICRAEYTGYTDEVSQYGHEYTFYVSEVDEDGEYLAWGEEDEVDPGLLRRTPDDALWVFNLAFPNEPVYGAIYNPTVETAYCAAGK